MVRSESIVHGKFSEIYHDERTIFEGMDNPFPAARYHSLIVGKKSLPDFIETSAWTEDGIIMGIRRKHINVEEVQFHPESILTKDGKKLLRNFLKTCKS